MTTGSAAPRDRDEMLARLEGIQREHDDEERRREPAPVSPDSRGEEEASDEPDAGRHAQTFHISTLADAIVAESQVPMVSTGFEQLDVRLGGGLGAGRVATVVAGTGRGKTAWALQVAAHRARTQPVVYALLEMSPAQGAGRIASQQLGCSWQDVLRARIPEKDIAEALHGLDITFVKGTTDEVLSEIMQRASAHAGPEPLLCVVDYIQLLADPAHPREATIAAVRGIHGITERYGLATLLLSQTSRNNSRAIAEGTGNAEDYEGVAAEASAVEHASTEIFVISFKAEDEAVVHDASLFISKSRFGTKGKVGFRFHGASGRWEELGAAPLNASEQARVEQIVDAIADLGGSAASLNAIVEHRTDGKKTVTGNKQSVRRHLERAIAVGAIRQDASGYTLTGGAQ